MRGRSSRAPLRLAVEYVVFVAAVVFALLLLATRVPLRWIDRATGFRLRERFIELIARIAPG